MNELNKTLTVAVLAGGSFLFPALLGAAEKVPLGINCGGGESSEGLDLFKAEEAKDWAAAIKAARAMLSEQSCENAYLWNRLALFSARLGRAEDALEIGAYTLERFPNWVGESLNEETDSFRELMALPGYAESTLKVALAARIAARDEKISGGKKLLAALPAAKRPPEAYVAKDACPFECCTFGEWSVEAEVELLKAPAGASLGRKLKVGDKVEGLTGEVHLRPRPMLVVHPFEAYRQNGDYDETVQIPAGGLVFELDSIGEGFFKFWHEGQIVEASGGGYLENRCLAFDAECWGVYLDPPGTPISDVWWVKVRLSDGTEAWALSDGFGNMDGCG